MILHTFLIHRTYISKQTTSHFDNLFFFLINSLQWQWNATTGQAKKKRRMHQSSAQQHTRLKFSFQFRSQRLSHQRGTKDFQIALIQTSVLPGVAHNASLFRASEEITQLLIRVFELKHFLRLNELYGMYEYRCVFTHFTCGKTLWICN